MANILFIGPYLQKDGWGNAAKEYVRALMSTRHNLTIRPIYMSTQPGEAPAEYMVELENMIYDHYDIIIQNVLPHYMDYNGTFKKNIGLLYTETGGFDYTSWAVRMNHMDEIWAPSDADLVNIKSSGVTKPIVKIPIPVNTEKFQQSYEKLPINNNFKFYFIGEYNQRKNLAALVRAFHLEFSPLEPVSLVIKTNQNGVDNEVVRQRVNTEIKSIKEGLRLYRNLERYSKEILIIERLTEHDMCRLHTTCDCFVMPSHGESFCMPAIDALGFGKTPIVTNHTGMAEFVHNSNGWLIDSYKTPVLVTDPPFPDLYTGREFWHEPTIFSLRECMREAYSNHRLREEKSENGIDSIYEYSYPNIAKLINDHTN